MRTLIVSDWHLGLRLRHDVLRHPRPLERLLDAARDVDRLVLLGDVVELMQGRPQQAMAVAEPVLQAVGSALPARAEVLLVPGNHDLPLIRRWVRSHQRSLELDTRVPLDASPALERMAAWLGAGRMTVRYPGAWLGERVWATHGQYLDRHLFPESAWGVTRGLRRPRTQAPARPGDYERRGPSLNAGSAWLPRPLAAMLEDGADLLRAATMPRVRRGLLNHRLAPLTSWLLTRQMRTAALPALAHVSRRLGVDADWIVFGHVHRLGPLPGEDPEPWCADGGSPRFVNCGSWLYEPLLVHRAQPPHPYWPGGAVLMEDGGDPQPVGLLDDLPPSVLR